MNITNISLPSGSVLTNDEELLSMAETLTCIFGLFVFVENAALIAVITKLWVKQDVKKDANDIVIHTLFVCANDLFSGLTVFIMGLIHVRSVATAHFCVYTVFMSMSLQIMSQGNITCICIQRYIGARNIRKLTVGKQRYRTLSLMLVNILIGGISLGSSIGQSYSSIKSTHGINDFCSFGAILGAKAGSIGLVYYQFGLVLTISADVLCFLTIRKLSTEINSVVMPEGTTTSSMTASTTQASTTSTVRTSVKLRQQKAIFTMLLILILLNLSVLPTLFGYALKMLGVTMTALDARILYLSIFLNSLINPIIIVTRVQDIRQEMMGVARRVTGLCISRG